MTVIPVAAFAASAEPAESGAAGPSEMDVHPIKASMQSAMVDRTVLGMVILPPYWVLPPYASRQNTYASARAISSEELPVNAVHALPLRLFGLPDDPGAV